jgi:transposase InsO family protein
MANQAFQPWHLLLSILAGIVNREQQQVIDYLRTENQVLREKIGKKRIILDDDQRKRLAVKGKVLGRKTLENIATIVTPDTIMRWHRMLVAAKWDYTNRRKSAGRPKLEQEIVDLALRFAKDNPSWGYDRIAGALGNLGHTVSDTSVGNILKAYGIEPAPDRKQSTSWKAFLKAHWDMLSAIDFTTVEVWTKGGLVTFYLLFVIDIKTRRVHFAGCTTSPNEVWMKQIARNISGFAGFLNGEHYLLMDRDTKFCRSFRRTLEVEGVTCLILPKRSPNLNGHIERFMRSIKEESLRRLIFFGEKSLRNAVLEYLEHYHGERNHQGLGNRLVEENDDRQLTTGDVQCRERLGGLLKYYHRDAA